MSAATPVEGLIDSLSLFNCPRCTTLFKTSARGAKCICPQCGVELRIPAPTGSTAVAGTGKTIVAEPLHVVPLDGARLHRLRVWAASVRDGEGIHAGGPAELARLAKTLCDLLDMRGGIQADNLRNAVDGNVAMLVGWLVLAGATGPG